MSLKKNEEENRKEGRKEDQDDFRGIPEAVAVCWGVTELCV